MRKEDLNLSLIVSCQLVPGGAMDEAIFVSGFARAALAAGGRALRIESAAYVAAVRAAVDAPIIGIVKRKGSIMHGARRRIGQYHSPLLTAPVEPRQQ